MMDGIGILRSFLKRFKDIRKGDKSEKLASSLKITDEIEHYENMIKTNS